MSRDCHCVKMIESLMQLDNEGHIRWNHYLLRASNEGLIGWNLYLLSAANKFYTHMIGDKRYSTLNKMV